jgi:hypothetical protein
MGNDEIGAGARVVEILVRAAHVRHHELANEEFRPAGRMEELADERRGVAHLCRVRADRSELDALALDGVAMIVGGRDDRMVTALPKLERDRDVRVQVSQRAEGGEHDALHRAGLASVCSLMLGPKGHPVCDRIVEPLRTNRHASILMRA